MRIVYQSADPFSYSDKYTPRKRAWNVFTRLARRGHEVYVIEQFPLFSDVKSKWDKTKILFSRLYRSEKKLDHNLHVINRKEFPRSISKRLWLFLQSVELPSIINDISPDVYIFNDPLTQVGVIEQLNEDIATVYDVKDFMPELVPLKYKSMCHQVERLLFRSADKVIAISHGLKDYSARTDATVIPSASKPHKQFKPKRKRARPRIGIAATMHLNSPANKVDFRLILDTAVLLPNCDFFLIGKLKGLPKLLPKNVKPIGFVRDYWSWIGSMDVNLIPYLDTQVSHMCSPLKLMDYASVGTPVVSTYLDEVKRLAPKEVYYGKTPSEFAQAIQDALKHGNLGIDKWAEKFSYEKLVDQYEKALEEVVY